MVVMGEGEWWVADRKRERNNIGFGNVCDITVSSLLGVSKPPWDCVL